MPRCLRGVREFDEIAESAVARVDPVVVRNIVAIVTERGDLKWHQPDGSDAEAMQIIEPAHESLEIPDTVAIGIHVGADRKAIDDRVLVPEIIDHGRCQRIWPTMGNCQPPAEFQRRAGPEPETQP